MTAVYRPLSFLAPPLRFSNFVLPVAARLSPMAPVQLIGSLAPRVPAASFKSAYRQRF
jgi:hypothetical protein